MSKPQHKSTEELTIIHKGATASDLGYIFGGNAKEVQKKIVGKVAPITAPDEMPVRWRIKDVAAFLCDLTHIDPEEYIKNLTPATLPPKLQDAFWKAQRSRQEFEKERGLLWSHQRVVEMLADALKPLRMTILMFQDTLGQHTELTDRQRELLDDIANGLLANLRDSMKEAAKSMPVKPDEHGKPIDVVEDEEEEDGLGDDDGLD